jgi:hypothetical protein
MISVIKIKLAALRENAGAAHVGPLLVFMLLSLFPGWIRVEDAGSPWFLRYPEHAWYPLQTLTCGGLLWWWRRQYSLPPCSLPTLLLATGLAAIGIVCWVLPGWLYQHWTGLGAVDQRWWRWLGVVGRTEGFTPAVFTGDQVAQILTLFFRFLRSCLVVAFVEELCWRGWLMRAVLAEDKPFTSVPFGTHSWKAYGITTLAVTLIHQPEDWVAAFIWGSLVYLLAIKTRSLRACIAMHAVGNLMLGLYIVRTGQYGYW